jgi:hypothetical protein
MANIDQIFVFKTNIRSKADKKTVQPLLDAHTCIERWNVDLEDCDCVLRIESATLDPQQVIRLINHHGFECCELI